MRRTPLIVALFLTSALTLLAPAAEAGGFYALGKLGSTDIDIDLADGFTDVLDGDDNSTSFGLGLNLGRFLVFQAEYHDLGNVPGFGSVCPFEAPVCVAQALPVEADSTAFSISYLPHLELSRWLKVYAKVGVISWDTDISTIGDLGGEFLEQVSDEDLLYGAGLRLEIPGPVDAFAEYERIADAFDTVAIGATWGF